MWNDVADDEGANEVYDLAEQSRNVIIDSILGPFGLSRLMFHDKNGGNVTTQHNVEQGIYARTEEKYDKEVRRTQYDYTSTQRAAIIEERKKGGQIVDEYSGQSIEHPSLDHGVPIKDYHDKGDWMQTQGQRKQFGQDPENLFVTDEGANKSMQETLKSDWQKKPSTKDPTKTNKEYYAQDNRRVNPRMRQAEKTAEEHLPTDAERLCYYAEHIGLEGLKEGYSLAKRQAIGIALKFFVEESWAILKDAWCKYKDGTLQGIRAFLVYVIEGFKQIRFKIQSLLKQLSRAALEGGVSGIVSTVITFLINTFVTTVKRIVAIIREIVNVLARTVATLMDKSKNKEERLNAAYQLLSHGIMTVLGMLMLETVISALKTTGVPFADEVGNVLVAIIVGLIGVLAVYLVVTYKNHRERKALIEKNESCLMDIRYKCIELLEIASNKTDVHLQQTYGMLNELATFISHVKAESVNLNIAYQTYSTLTDNTLAEISKSEENIKDGLKALKNRYGKK